MFCIFISFFFSKYYAWKILKLCLYKGMFVLFWNQVLKYQLLIKKKKKVLKYQLNFKSFRIISLFTYLGQLRVFSSLFVIFSLSEFSFLSSIHSFCCNHAVSEQS
jgi:hypothetical protein